MMRMVEQFRGEHESLLSPVQALCLNTSISEDIALAASYCSAANRMLYYSDTHTHIELCTQADTCSQPCTHTHTHSSPVKDQV